MRTTIGQALLTVACVLFPLSLLGLAAEDVTVTGNLAGQVLDADDQPVADACVLLCDAESGIPCLSATYMRLTDAMIQGQSPMDLATVVTDAQGRFAFESVPMGSYRLVAQTWNDVSPPKVPFEVNGEELTLRGVAENVSVSADSSGEVVIRPLGSGTLKLDEKLGNDETLLVLSTAPPRADPILAFVGWGGPFLAQAIGVNRMPSGRSIIHGLPEGKIHLTLFAADDNPGWGAGEVTIQAGKTAMTYVPIVASWSDGHHDPPTRLLPLVEELASLDSAVELLTQAGMDIEKERKAAKNPWEFQRYLSAHLTKTVELPSGQSATVADVMAAVGYLDMRKTLERRQAARASAQKPANETPVDYAEAFRALYDELGSNYPCFELKGIDWAEVGERLLPRAAEFESEDAFALLCVELIAQLQDSHAYLHNGSRNLPPISYPRWAPGFACLIDDQGNPVVYHIAPGGPAEMAGVQIGMTVLSIDNQPASDAIADCEAQITRYSGYSSDRYLRYQAARWFSRRITQGTTMKLQMQSVDGETHDYELPTIMPVRYLPRLPVPIPNISDSADVDWTMLDGNIGYIYVRRIRSSLIEDLDIAVGELKDAQGFVVDVRGNSGGGFDAARAHRNFAPDDEAEPERPRFAGPIALLLDARTISAGEGWASWFIAEKRAKVLGQATAGASARKTTSDVAGGRFRVTYPVKPYSGYLDRVIERRGLEPDVPVTQNAADLAAGRDTVLETAKAYLLQQR